MSSTFALGLSSSLPFKDKRSQEQKRFKKSPLFPSSFQFCSISFMVFPFVLSSFFFCFLLKTEENVECFFGLFSSNCFLFLFLRGQKVDKEGLWQGWSFLGNKNSSGSSFSSTYICALNHTRINSLNAVFFSSLTSVSLKCYNLEARIKLQTVSNSSCVQNYPVK